MNASKLVIYVAIAETLFRKGPLAAPKIEEETGIEPILIGKCLDFLVNQGIIAQKTSKKNMAVYEITQRGIRILRYFKKFADTKLPSSGI